MIMNERGYLMRAKEERTETMAAQTNARRRIADPALALSKNELK